MRVSAPIGLLVLAGLWLTSLPELIPGAFSAHMAVHMGVVAVAAPLIALGIAGSRHDPVRRVPTLFAPIPISVAELVVVWLWHAPVLHQLARSSRLGFILEQGSFFVCGLALWLSAFGADGHGGKERRAAGAVALLLTFMHMTLLGALLALSSRPLYSHPRHHASTLSPLEDQHLGGAIMLLVGGISYLTGTLWLSGSVLREQMSGRPAQRQRQMLRK